MSLHHLSHTDGDGLSSSFLVNEQISEKGNININGTVHTELKQYNADYSELDLTKDRSVFELIFEDIAEDTNTPHTLLITDLNFKTVEDADILEKMALKHKVELILIDHHDSGKKVAEAKDWYSLDDTKSATLQLFLTLKKWAGENILEEHTRFVECMDDYDIYKNYLSPEFINGELINSVTREIKNTLPYENNIDNKDFNYSIIRDYTFFVYRKLSKALNNNVKLEKLPILLETFKKDFIEEYKDTSIAYFEHDITDAESASEFIERNLKAEDVVTSKNLSTEDKLKMLFYIYEEIEPQNLFKIEKRFEESSLNKKHLENDFIKEIKKLAPPFVDEDFKESKLYEYIQSNDFDMEKANIMFEELLVELAFSIQTSIDIGFKSELQSIFEDESIITQLKADFFLETPETDILKDKEALKIQFSEFVVNKLAETDNIPTNFKLTNYLKDLSNQDIPARLRISMLLGAFEIEQLTKKEIPYKKGFISIVTDIRGGLFQQGSYILANKIKPNDIYISISDKGFVSVRASNGEAAPVAGFFGGGGHPNAGGGNISSFIPEQLLAKQKELRNMGGKKEEISVVQSEINSILVDKISISITDNIDKTNNDTPIIGK